MSNGSTEADIYAEFGVEPLNQQPEAADPAGTGGKEQGVAGPDGAFQATGNAGTDSSTPLRSARNDGTGNGGRPVTAPTAGNGTSAEDGTPPHPTPAAVPPPQGEGVETGETDTAKNGGTGDPAPTGDGTKEPEPMSREERAEQARLRREREYKAREDAAVRKALEERDAQHEQELKGIFAAAGMTDRYNGGKAITTKAEFDAWQSRAQTERLSRQLKEGTLTPESFQAAVNEAPAVKEAAALVEQLKAREAQEKAQADKEAFDRQVAAELANIHSMDPGVNSLKDILNLPTGQEFRRLVEVQGLSYEQAFKLANMDRISAARAQAAAQGAALRTGGKEHLRSVVASGGSVPMDVPRDVIEMYRDMCPELSMEQIRQDYQKRYKG